LIRESRIFYADGGYKPSISSGNVRSNEKQSFQRKLLVWKIASLEVEGDTFSVELSCQDHIISIIAEVTFEGRVAMLWNGHIGGDGANTLGAALLRSLTRWAMEFLDVDELRIAGATRTSGAGPGRIPSVLVFRRNRSRGLGG
jgi:hypothetical protein